MIRLAMALVLLSACTPDSAEHGADTDVEPDTVGVDTDALSDETDATGVGTETVAAETDSLEADTVVVDTDTVGVDTDTVGAGTDQAVTDTNIDPADVNDTVDYGGHVTGAGFFGLCDQRRPGEMWLPDTNLLVFGEHFGESLLRYGVTERSVLAAGGAPTWVNVPAQDTENLPYDPRHAVPSFALPSVPGQYAIEMQVHRNGRDATWHQVHVSSYLCDLFDPGWINLDTQYQTWVTIVAGLDTGGPVDTDTDLPVNADTDLILDSDTGAGGP